MFSYLRNFRPTLLSGRVFIIPKRTFVTWNSKNSISSGSQIEELNLKYKKYENRLDSSGILGVGGVFVCVAALDINPIIPMIPFFYNIYKCIRLENKIKTLKDRSDN